MDPGLKKLHNRREFNKLPPNSRKQLLQASTGNACTKQKNVAQVGIAPQVQTRMLEITLGGSSSIVKTGQWGINSKWSEKELCFPCWPNNPFLLHLKIPAWGGMLASRITPEQVSNRIDSTGL